MNKVNDFMASVTKIINFGNSECESIGSNLRDNVLTAAGANRNLSVVIACDTVTLYGYEEDAYAQRAVDQVRDAGGLNCTAYVV